MQQTNTWLSFKKSFFLIKTFSSTGQADWWRTNYGENACTKTCSSPMIALLWWQIGQRGNTGMTLDDKDVILSKHGCRFLLCNIRSILPFLTREANHITRQEHQYWTMDWTIMGSSFYTPLPFTCFLLQLTCISRPRCKPAGQWRALPLLPPSHHQSLQSGGTLVT